MPTIGARVFLLLGAYFPLAIFLAAKYTFASTPKVWLGLVILGLSVIGLLGTIPVFKSIYSLGPTLIKVATVKRAGEKILAYSASYIIPFMGLVAGSKWEIFSLITFLAFTFYVYIRETLVYLNPVLYLVGFRIYEITTEQGNTLTVLSKSRITPNSSVPMVKISESTRIVKQTNKQGVIGARSSNRPARHP